MCIIIMCTIELINKICLYNKVKKPHKPRYCEKEKDKANKRILRRKNSITN